ncbi:arylsulfatase [Ensifer sp.]|jgi:arylsulfatase A-like enzyme|uniref:arylsulfatase B n=1 Tax=Ensifer sp. TaxID=1872086 RepID=UPI002E0D6B22|nr:arylsulfatase [Ensifer sp.]
MSGLQAGHASTNARDLETTEATKGGTRLTRRQALLGGAAAVALAAGLPSGLGGISATPARADGTTPPNIVYIIADDLGWADLGFRGSDIRTPNLDKLAETGVVFDEFYTQPMCTPTRAAFLTGRYPLRYGLQTGVIPAAGSYGLALDEYLLSQALKEAGYRTALVGKWHLGHAKPEFWPKQRGFDTFYGALVGEIDHFKHSSHGVKDWYRGNKPLEETGFDNSLFADEAAKVVEGHDPKAPLFLYLAFTAPHTPFQAPQEYLDRYKHIADENRRAYAAMISVVDDGVGKLMAALEKKGMRDNTLIVFHSDNGGVTSSLFAGDSKVSGGLPADNGPYRDGKGTLYEGGTRVSALANWPKMIRPGKLKGMVHVVDMYPTLAAIAGAPLDENKPLDGVNLWGSLVEGKPSPRAEVVYNVDPLAGAVRRDKWKLIWKAALPQKIELFDLSSDPYETKDLSAESEDRVRELQDRITDLAGEMVQPLLLMDATRLTFYAPPIAADPATLFNLGD